MLDNNIALFLSPAFILALTELVKRVTTPKKRYIPLISVTIGVVVFLILGGLDKINLFTGILVGLSASGLWDIGKKTVSGN